MEKTQFFGIKNYADGYQYQGKFHGNLRDDYGELYNENGQIVYCGDWSNDVEVNYGKNIL